MLDKLAQLTWQPSMDGLRDCSMPASSRPGAPLLTPECPPASRRRCDVWRGSPGLAHAGLDQTALHCHVSQHRKGKPSPQDGGNDRNPKCVPVGRHLDQDAGRGD